MEHSEMVKKIPQWEKEYLDACKKVHPTKLSKRQVELLEGSPIKSNEGMIYGQMYAHWKSTQLEK